MNKKEFLNNNTSEIKDFIINKEINEYDLFKLAQLNQIELEIGKGWNHLVLNLIQDLHKMGWNKKVSCIKEKYGTLRFYPENNFNISGFQLEDLMDDYISKSEKICEACGEKGELKEYNGIYFTACDVHGRASKQKPE
ncbi:hypothetical protein [Psychroserpens algicola]|uniref:Uncharacterized protein n=1 Tax=Psychroserpens algicola TaxID=1719034 RepID=A0ABT0HEI5_9FLAO|nr:hypothetical protein [Psychroserpens algicola]MCK8482275.1 hypothetical protein [Psychroserpens algicola]